MKLYLILCYLLVSTLVFSQDTATYNFINFPTAATNDLNLEQVFRGAPVLFAASVSVSDNNFQARSVADGPSSDSILLLLNNFYPGLDVLTADQNFRPVFLLGTFPEYTSGLTHYVVLVDIMDRALVLGRYMVVITQMDGRTTSMYELSSRVIDRVNKTSNTKLATMNSLEFTTELTAGMEDMQLDDYILTAKIDERGYVQIISFSQKD